MATTKQIYSDKLKVRTHDIDDLVTIMEKGKYNIINNQDRSLLIYSHEERDDFEDNLAKFMKRWLKNGNLECHIKHAYNSLPITHDTTLIKV